MKRMLMMMMMVEVSLTQIAGACRLAVASGAGEQVERVGVVDGCCQCSSSSGGGVVRRYPSDGMADAG